MAENAQNRKLIIIIACMQQTARHTAIVEALNANGSIGVAQIADSLGVSLPTVRRDLQLLEDQGLLHRTHGGAVVPVGLYELPLRYRKTQRREEKVRIAREAASRIPERATIGLTGGTTTTEVARALAGKAGLTIVTNAINIASELTIRPNLQLIVTGGIVRHQSYELVGPIADHVLGTLYLDIAFVGVDGISPDGGLTTFDSVEAHTGAVLIQRARRVIVVADHSKLGRIAFAKISDISPVHELITDRAANQESVEALRGRWFASHIGLKSLNGTQASLTRRMPESRRRFDVLVVGDINLDTVIRGRDVTPAYGQKEKLVDEIKVTIGGSSAITACALANLGLATAMFGAVGNDVSGTIVLRALAARGVHVASCPKLGETPTGATVILSQGADRAILTSLGAIGRLQSDDVPRRLINQARHLHVGGYFLLAAAQSNLPALFQRARSAGLTTSLDTNWDPAERWNGNLLSLLRHTDILFPNEQEVCQIASEKDPVEAAFKLVGLVAGSTKLKIAVKKGDGGAFLVSSGRV